MTAVEWLVAHLYAEGVSIRKELVDEAIEREKKQTQDAWKMSKLFNNPSELPKDKSCDDTP